MGADLPDRRSRSLALHSFGVEAQVVSFPLPPQMEVPVLLWPPLKMSPPCSVLRCLPRISFVCCSLKAVPFLPAFLILFLLLDSRCPHAENGVFGEFVDGAIDSSSASGQERSARTEHLRCEWASRRP